MASLDNNEQYAQHKDSASTPVPSDKEIPYTFTSIKDPALLPPGGQGRMPGHKQADPRAIYAAAAAAWEADVAEADAKRAAQFKADTQGKSALPPQHPTTKANYKAAPRRKGK